MIIEEPSDSGALRSPKSPSPVASDRLGPKDVRALARFFELLERWARNGPANDNEERDD